MHTCTYRLKITSILPNLTSSITFPSLMVSLSSSFYCLFISYDSVPIVCFVVVVVVNVGSHKISFKKIFYPFGTLIC